jgi:hypothetical protein
METAIRGDTLLKLGGILFSAIALLEAVLLVVGAWLSLKVSTEGDELRTKTDIDALDLVESGAIAAIAIILALGAIAVWNKSLPGRRLLLGATIVGLLVINSAWLLNALGIANIYFN